MCEPCIFSLSSHISDFYVDIPLFLGSLFLSLFLYASLHSIRTGNKTENHNLYLFSGASSLSSVSLHSPTIPISSMVYKIPYFFLTEILMS